LCLKKEKKKRVKLGESSRRRLFSRGDPIYSY